MSELINKPEMSQVMLKEGQDGLDSSVLHSFNHAFRSSGLKRNGTPEQANTYLVHHGRRKMCLTHMH
jgi:hypothetical protein